MGTCVATTNETCGLPITFVITGTNSQNFGVLNGINVCTAANKTCVQSYVINYIVNSLVSTATSFSGTTSFNQGSLVNSSASACVDPSSNQLTALTASQGSTAFTATVASYSGMSPGTPSLITVTGNANPYLAAIKAAGVYMEMGDYMADGVTYAAGVNLTTGSAATGTSNMAMILGSRSSRLNYDDRQHIQRERVCSHQ